MAYNCGGGCGNGSSSSDKHLEEDDDDEDWVQIWSKLNKDDEIHVQKSPEEGKEFDLSVEGVKVVFPYEPYKSQRQFMSMVIKGVKNCHNCLLESPTGTGKTAALLCSLLGWQAYCRKKEYTNETFAEIAAQDAGPCTCGFLLPKEIGETKLELLGQPKIECRRGSYGKKYRLVADFKKTTEKENTVDFNGDGEDTILEDGSPSKMAKIGTTVVTRKKGKDQLCRYCVMTYFNKRTVPKIFYATRTHSQVQQVVEQLKGSHYRNTKMTILASRKQGCIKKELIQEAKQNELSFQNHKANKSSSPSKSNQVSNTVQSENMLLPIKNNLKDARSTLDDSCRVLRKNFYANKKKEANNFPSDGVELAPVCEFFAPPDDLGHALTFMHLSAWDIEDIKTVGLECGACPYYGSQALYENADIVFCPYNYLISPVIRSAVDIDLTGNIIVFDEAHNLEDICRDEASMNMIDLNRLDGRIRRHLDDVLDKAGQTLTAKKAAAEQFSFLLRKLSTWMRNTAPQIPEPNIYASSKCSTVIPKFVVFKGNQMLDIFNEIGLGQMEMDCNFMHLAALTNLDDDENDSSKLETQTTQKGTAQDVKFDVPTDVTRFVAKLLSTLKYMFQDGNSTHYNMVLVNNGDPLKPLARDSMKICDQKKQPVGKQYNIVLEIMCLSPAVAFKTIRDNAHSIIVTSGTLTPLNSFAVELDTPFQIRFICEHVVRPHQTLSCCVSSGVHKKLTLNKTGQMDTDIQDDLLLSILQICQNVPHGVVVFLPSYSFMDILKQRMSLYPANNPVLKQLEVVKHVFYEERRDKEVFEKEMAAFKHLISHPIQNSSQSGCILFAIFRGKVSEGINFSDNQARAVVTVGIPFSNFSSYPVMFKREYNDERKKRPESSASNKVEEGVAKMKTMNPNHKDLLSGDEWYEIQAFRAMNQAFGRCVRHKEDWGAIILMESRISRPHFRDKLSTWVRSGLQIYTNFDALNNTLVQFMQDRVNNIPPTPPRDSINLDINVSHNYDSEVLDENKHTRLTPVYNDLKLSTKCKSKYTNVPVHKSCSSQVDLDSSSYSLDESDCVDVPLKKQTKSTSRPAANVHELDTLVIAKEDTSSDDEFDLSYHSSSSTSSVDMIEGTP